MKLSGWGNYPVIDMSEFLIEKPQTIHCIQTAVRKPGVCISRGMGKSYGDSAISAQLIDITNHQSFVAFNEATGVLEVQSGALLSEIIDAMVPRGWFPIVVPGSKLITVGGAIASDVHGKNHHLSGCFSECVISIKLMLADGTVILCNRSENTDLFRATCGGMGLTGVIISAVLRLKKIKSANVNQTSIKTANLEESLEAFEAYKDITYSVAWIDCLARGKKLGRSILTVGDFSDDGSFEYPQNKTLSVPPIFPSFSLNNLSVAAFNQWYYTKAPSGTTQQTVSFNSFFFPLDAVLHWNRIYGKIGFLQYQFIVPQESGKEGLRAILDKIARSGRGSFLAVLKQYGPANRNYLSFPMAGYSLALDFKISPGLFKLLDELDALLVKYGGRIYLAKDARMGVNTFEAGYSKANEFRELRCDNGFNLKFHSIQSMRLGI